MLMNIQIVLWAVVLYSPSLMLKWLKIKAAFLQNVFIHVQDHTCHNPEDYSLKRTVTVFMALSLCKKMVFA